MAEETQRLWIVFLGIGAAVLGVVVLLLGLLRESVKVLVGRWRPSGRRRSGCSSTP